MFTNMKLLVIIVSLFTFSKGLEINPKLVVEFLNFYHLNIAVLFYCGSAPRSFIAEMQNEFKYFAVSDITSETFDEKHAENIVKLTYHKQGVIIDLTCEQTGKVFSLFSRSNFFNASYFWLMVSPDLETSTELLRSQNINLDAEITLALINDMETAQLFDIYNPNSRTNGQLVVQPKGSWKESTGFIVSLNEPKYDRRSNLNGIVIHAGIVVAHRGNQTLLKYLESKSLLQRIEGIFAKFLFLR